jgi:hypothetical protein
MQPEVGRKYSLKTNHWGSGEKMDQFREIPYYSYNAQNYQKQLIFSITEAREISSLGAKAGLVLVLILFFFFLPHFFPTFNLSEFKDNKQEHVNCFPALA